MSGSIFAPDYPPLLRQAALWGIACFVAEVDFGRSLERLGGGEPTEPDREEIGRFAAADRGREKQA